MPKNVLRLLVVSVAAFVALLVGSSQALADSASCVFNASADKKVVTGGKSVGVSATANVDCAWTVTWNGETRRGKTAAGVPFTATFTAPQVSKRTVINAKVSCAYDVASCDALSGGGRVGSVWNKSIPITVLPSSQGAPAAAAAGDLPNTGGPSWYLLAGGLLLVLAGAGAVRASRRDTTEVGQS